MKRIKGSTVSETATLLFVMLFLYTGICKIMDYPIFKEQIAASPLLTNVAPLIALSLPWIEFLIVMMLVVPKWRLWGLYSSLTIMMTFTVYILAILLFDKQIPCSCGGVIEELTWTQHIIFNIVFIILAVLGILGERERIRENKRDHQLIIQKA